MSNEELHIDGDFTLNIPHFEADFAENEQPKMQADFKIQTGGSTSFANITGSPYDNEALSDALNQKADTSTVETLSETVENNYTELDGKITDESDARTQADADLQSNIDDVTDDLSIETDNRQTADADLQDNIDTVDGKIDTHIADKSNPHEVTKAQIGLGNVDNTSDLNKPISTATQTALNGKQNTINDLSEIRTNASNGQSAYNTIQNYGDIVTYDASSFATSIQGQKADTALQPNDNITELNNNAGYITSASLPTVNNNKITIQKNSTDAGSFTLNQSSDKTINISVPTQASDINAVPTSRKINNKPLSSDITLTASDVGALPSSTVIGNGTLTIQNNSVDVDTFSANATSNKTINIVTPTKTSDLTNDSGFIDNTDLTNGLATKQDTISDLSTIRSNAANGQSAYTTIGGYGDIVTYNASNFVQKNGDSSTQTISLTSGTGTTALGIKSMATSSYISLSGSSGWLGSYGVTSNKRPAFYNGTGYTLAYTSEIPTNTSELTNDSGYITGIDSSDVTTALGYTPYDSANPAGYTSNVGTVTSVNNTQPDANGNVTISVTGGANTDLSNLTATGEAHFLKNNTSASSSLSILGSSSTNGGGISIGTQSSATNSGIAIGYGESGNSSTTATGINSIALGVNAKATALCSIQLGSGTNSTANSLYFGSYVNNQIQNYQLLDGTTGLIPDARISANIQRTSTAVTHPASTAIGGVDVPVFVNSNGEVISTGKSIASSRFDGQWVQSFTTLMESSGTKNGVQISLSSYLPSDSYKYNVKFKLYCYDDDSTYYYHIETDIFNSGSTATGKDASTQIAGGTYSRQNINIFDLPIGIGRYIKVYGSGADEINIYALGYRRIGTNS